MAKSQEGRPLAFVKNNPLLQPPGYEKDCSNALWQSIDGYQEVAQAPFPVSKETGLGSQQC